MVINHSEILWEIHKVRKGLWALFVDCAFWMLIGWAGKLWWRGLYNKLRIRFALLSAFVLLRGENYSPTFKAIMKNSWYSLNESTTPPNPEFGLLFPLTIRRPDISFSTWILGMMFLYLILWVVGVLLPLPHPLLFFFLLREFFHQEPITRFHSFLKFPVAMFYLLLFLPITSDYVVVFNKYYRGSVFNLSEIYQIQKLRVLVYK